MDQQQPPPPSITVVPIPTAPPPVHGIPPPNLPRSDLFEGSRQHYTQVGVPLYQAAIRGDWGAAKPILYKQPHLVRVAITENYETLLHVAASAQSTKAVTEFVSKLVDMMAKEDLELQNKNYNTALSLAAAAGNVKTAMIMVKKNPALIDIPGNNKTMPLYMAALFSRTDMVRYLYGISKKMSGDYWEHANRGWVLLKCVEADIFDVAINILIDRPELINRKGLMSDLLLALAEKTYAFKGTKLHIIYRIINLTFAAFHVNVPYAEKECEALQLLKLIWCKIAILPKSEIDDILRGPPLLEGSGKRGYPSRVLFVATKEGNTRFITELIQSYPDLIWKQDDKGKTIFHLAIKRRKAEIYSLLYEAGGMKELITPIKDRNGNNMLHMVAKGSKRENLQSVPGAALQMHEEFLWFKEVEQMIPPQYRRRKNMDGRTPKDLFAEKHARLLTNGDNWLEYYMLVATLIATVVFAAAFTLPGGYNQDTGTPFFHKEPSLIIFVISDAISLVSASTSVLIFLSILTSSSVELGFFESLPKHLMLGLATLFLSIVSMMVAFSASFFVLYDKKLAWLRSLSPVLLAFRSFYLRDCKFIFSGMFFAWCIDLDISLRETNSFYSILNCCC